DVPKLFDQRRSRLDPGRPAAENLPRLAEPDRSDGEGTPFRPGRQPRRDRPSGRRLRAPCTRSMNVPPLEKSAPRPRERGEMKVAPIITNGAAPANPSPC